MVDAWPASLPQSFLYDGLAMKEGDARLRSQPETGPSVIRKRTSAVVDTITGSMVVTDAQWSALKAFGKTTLDGWSLPFSFPDPDGGGDILVRFGEALPARTKVTPNAWKVSISLEVLP